MGGIFKKLIIAFVVATAVPSCADQGEVDFHARSIELERENKKLNKQLQEITATVREMQQNKYGVVRERVISKPVTYKGGGETLKQVVERKVLRCGGNADLPGFGFLSPDSGQFEGFDIDVCRAIGAAVLGKQGSSQIEVLPLTSKLRFASLQSGRVDVLTRNTTWTMSRDAELRTNFAAVTFYDGQGILVRDASNIKKLSDLQDKAVCVQAGSTSASNMVDYMASLGISIELNEYSDRVAAREQYDRKACEAFTGDKTSLLAQRSLLSIPENHTFLFGSISREPLGPVVRHDDDNWKDVVTWTVQCLINAEAQDVSYENVEEKLQSEDIGHKWLLGLEGRLGEQLGLSNDFCYQVIKQVGNYKDIYERHLGPDTEFNLPRGINSLYSDGGLHYPLPFR